MRRNQFEKPEPRYGVETFTREQIIAMVRAVYQEKLKRIQEERGEPLTDQEKAGITLTYEEVAEASKQNKCPSPTTIKIRLGLGNFLDALQFACKIPVKRKRRPE